jgi:HSP20 family protein
MMRLMTVPFNELEKIYRQIDQAFDESYSTGSNRPSQPPVELKETAESLVLRAMLPGVDREQLNIEVTRSAVLISGSYPEPQLPEKSQYFRSEFYRGQFRRVISLPFFVDNTAVKANYEQGILTLTLPKAPEVINQVVKVSVVNRDRAESEMIPGTSSEAIAPDSDELDNPWDA